MRLVSVDEVMKLSAKINNKFTCGNDEIPTAVVKRKSIPITKDTLCTLINNAFK